MKTTTFTLIIVFTIFNQLFAASFPKKFALEMPVRDSSIANSVYDDVGVPHKIQHEQIWCWAAVSALVIDYYSGNGIQDCGAASILKNRNCCSMRQPACLTTATAQDIGYILNSQQISNRYVNAPASFNQIVEVISNRQIPIIAYFMSRSGPVGHFIVISGYDTDSETVVVNDPMQRGPITIPYQQLFNYGPNRDLYWAGSVMATNR